MESREFSAKMLSSPDTPALPSAGIFLSAEPPKDLPEGELSPWDQLCAGSGLKAKPFIPPCPLLLGDVWQGTEQQPDSEFQPKQPEPLHNP